MQRLILLIVLAMGLTVPALAGGGPAMGAAMSGEAAMHCPPGHGGDGEMPPTGNSSETRHECIGCVPAAADFGASEAAHVTTIMAPVADSSRGLFPITLAAEPPPPRR